VTRFLDPHVHMSSRTTDDYQAMAQAGIVAVIEPAFWQGQLRTRVGTFKDYFASLVGWERFRASQFGIRHYCAIGVNSKEANNEGLAREVLEILPLYLCKEGVVAVGEIGFDDQTPAEERIYRAQLELAKEAGLPVMVHTPHRDKRRGTSRSMDLALEHGLAPDMVVIDHNNEETVAEVLDRGFWAGFTIYPRTKMDAARMVEIVRKHGKERVIVDSSADWGVSDPLSVVKTANLMREKGIPADVVEAVTYGNALEVYGKSGQMKAEHWLKAAPVDQTKTYGPNTVLRGQAPRVDVPARR
jgi:predicted metal-dependent TIM-barrel fold hydrolase